MSDTVTSVDFNPRNEEMYGMNDELLPTPRLWAPASPAPLGPPSCVSFPVFASRSVNVP
jgi:hypothetical protein